MTQAEQRPAKPVDRVVTKSRLLGNEQRWRRFGEPTPAGRSQHEDGTTDMGLFGPGSLAWEVILHPGVMALETVAQGFVQTAYKPIHAGVRDKDPMTRKGLAGTLTIMDIFDRTQRNSGIHAPMWLGDTATARRVSGHLINIHQKVASDVIDVGEPELGGYAANGPRDAMWAALTEAEAMMWLFEGVAYRAGKTPHAFSPEERDEYIREFAPYVELFPHEHEPPRSMAELDRLHKIYAPLFQHSPTMEIMPEGGHEYSKWLIRTALKNFHISQIRVLMPMGILFSAFGNAVKGCLPTEVLESLGLTLKEQKKARRARRRALPALWLLQRGPIERYFMRLMWGPDAVALIMSARALHRNAKQARS